MIIRLFGNRPLKTIKVIALFLLLLYHTRGHAQPIGNESFSRANFAFLVNNNSSLGFNNVGGSTLIFDVGNAVSSKVDLGLRTLATGGANEKSRFYRLGSGILLIYHAFPTFMLHISPGIFHETATLGAKLDSGHREELGYTGTQWIAGWEKQIVAIDNAMKINWGSFVVYHSGIRDDPSSGPSGGSLAPTPAESKGLATGVEFSFEFLL